MHRRFVIAATLAVGAILAAAPLMVQALQPPSYFSTYVGNGCVYGKFGVDNASLTMTLKAPNGHLLDTKSATSDSDGDITMSACFAKVVKGGDRIKATDGSVTHSLTVPKLTVLVDRDTDVVSGTAPAGDHVAISTCHVTDYSGCAQGPDIQATANGQGRYSMDVSFQVDLTGSDNVNVVWTGPHSDLVSRYSPTPYMTIYLDQATVAGGLPAGEVATMTLRAANGTVRGTVSATGGYDYGNFGVDFMKNGHTVVVKRGNKVRADLAADAHLTIPNVLIAATNGTDTVSANCFANAPFLVDVHHPNFSDASLAHGTTDGSGDLAVDMSNAEHPTYDLVAGDVITLHCRNAAGDEVVASGTS